MSLIPSEVMTSDVLQARYPPPTPPPLTDGGSSGSRRPAGCSARMSAQRSRRPHLCRAGDRQPDQRAGSGDGRLDTVSAKGGDIIAPDDVAFDPSGNLYATEVMDAGSASGTPPAERACCATTFSAPTESTVHAGRLFVNECREGGRLMELDGSGAIVSVLAENLPSPNAMEVGPDGMLYYPLMTANEIWRIDPNGGEPQRVAGDLGVPMRSSSTPRASSSPPRWPVARCCVSIRAPAPRACWRS